MARSRLLAPLRKLTVGLSRPPHLQGREKTNFRSLSDVAGIDFPRSSGGNSSLGFFQPRSGLWGSRSPFCFKQSALRLQLRHSSYVAEQNLTRDQAGSKGFVDEPVLKTEGDEDQRPAAGLVDTEQQLAFSNIEGHLEREGFSGWEYTFASTGQTTKEGERFSEATVISAPDTLPRSHILTEVLTVLNGIEKTDDLSVKLASYAGNISFQEATTVMKLLNDKRLCFSFYTWLKEQPNFVPNFTSLVTVMRFLLITGKWEKLNLVSQDLFDAGYVLDNAAYCRIIKEASLSGKVAVCEWWFQKMKERGCSPDQISYNTMIHAYALARLPQKSFALYNEMKEAGVDPDMNTFCHLLTACQKTGDHETAHNMFLQMSNLGMTPNLVAYSILLDTLGKNGKAPEAAALFKDMKDVGVVPDAKAYNTLMQAYANAGMINEAAAAFQEYHKSADKNPDKIVYWTMLLLYSRAGMLKQALAVKRMMRVAKIPVDVSCYLNLIDGFRRKERWEDAARAFKEMQRYKYPIEIATLEMMMKVYSKAGHHVECERVFDLLMSKGYKDRLLVYEIMISIYKRTNNIKNSTHIYELMKRNNCLPNRNVCNIMIHIYAKAGMLPACEKIADEMGTTGIKPNKNTFLSLIRAYATYGQYSSAMDVYDLMQETGVKPDYELSELIVDVLLKNQELEKAERFLKSVVAEGINPNKRMVSAILKAGGVVELSRPLAVAKSSQKSLEEGPVNSLKLEKLSQ